MPPLEGDEKKSKKGKGVKILTPYKVSITIITTTILSAERKTGNDSYKL